MDVMELGMSWHLVAMYRMGSDGVESKESEVGKNMSRCRCISSWGVAASVMYLRASSME